MHRGRRSTAPSELYDEIGSSYSATRRADPRIASAIRQALGDAGSVVNVGAGTGAYELPGRTALAVEPSAAMIARRPPGAPPAVQAYAEALPLADASFDAATAILTIHHWRELGRGLRELRRVAHTRVVILTWDPSFAGTFWLTARYLPGLDRWSAAHYPALEAVAAELGPLERIAVPVPRDCEDGFLRAFWARPEAYLNEAVRRNMSPFAYLEDRELAEGLGRLQRELESGEWDRRFGELRSRESLDLGYCLLVASWRASASRARRASSSSTAAGSSPRAASAT